MDDINNTTNNNTNNTNKEKFKINLQALKVTYLQIFRRNRKLIVIISAVIILILVTVIGVIALGGSGSSSQSNGQNVQISTLKKANINRNFDFPILDDKQKQVGTVSYEILSTELDKNILVQGKFATAVSGKLFFVVNIKLTNNQDKGISINTKDYLRLSINGNFTELLAPSLHNDPVTVQPISIQNSRLGFIVSENDKDFVIQIGEIKGSKQKIKINFQ